MNSLLLPMGLSSLGTSLITLFQAKLEMSMAGLMVNANYNFRICLFWFIDIQKAFILQQWRLSWMGTSKEWCLQLIENNQQNGFKKNGAIWPKWSWYFNINAW